MASPSVDWVSVFTPHANKLLNSRDVISQGDTGIRLFDTWYAYAVAYAKGEFSGDDLLVGTEVMLSFLVATHKRGILTDGAADDYVIRGLMENFRKVCTIFTDKAKFIALLSPPGGASLVSSLQRHLELLTQTSLHNGCPYLNRTEYLKSLSSLVALGDAITKAYPNNYPTSPLVVDITKIVPICANLGMDEVYRGEALDLVKRLYQAGNVDARRLLARVAKDRLSLEVLFAMGALRDPEIVQMLIQRARQAPSTGVQTPFPLELITSISYVLNSDSVNVDIDMDVILDICQVCDITKSEYKEEPERAQELIGLLGSLLQECPNNTRLLGICLNPLTLESLHMVAGAASLYSEETWTTVLLPLIENRFGSMSLQGVSGDQLEQEIINLLRECCRIFYLNKDMTPSTQLGHRLLFDITQAMRRGYIETERFPELAGALIEFHLPFGSQKWIPPILAPEICSSLKNTRAMNEIISRLLGMEPYNDISSPVGAEQQQTVLEALASTPTNAAFSYMMDLCRNNREFVLDQEPTVWTLLGSMDVAIGNMAKRRKVDTILLRTIQDLSALLALRITPNNAPLLLEVTLKALALATDVSGYNDESLALIIDKIPADTKASSISSLAISEALSVGGYKARFALCSLVPDLCLTDREPGIRCQAFRVLEGMPDRLATLSDTIFEALDPNINSGYIDSHLNLHDVELAVAAAPVLSELCKRKPSVVGASLDYLCRAAKTSAKDDALTQTHPAILEAIDSIVNNISPTVLAAFVTSPRGLNLLPVLVRLSQSWAAIVGRMEGDGVVTRGTLGTYGVSKASSSSSSSSSSSTAAAAGGSDDDDKATKSLLVLVEARNSQDSARLLSNIETGDVMEALRLAHNMKLRDPSRFDSSVVRSQLLPQLAATVLPTPTIRGGVVTFSPKALDEASETLATMKSVRAMFPEEAESVLQLQSRENDLSRAVIRRFLDNNDSDGARKWLAASAIRSPALLREIESAEAARTARNLLARPPAFTSTATAGPSGQVEAAPAYTAIAPPERTQANEDVWTSVNAFRPRASSSKKSSSRTSSLLLA